jgi:hypothetical protein
MLDMIAVYRNRKVITAVRSPFHSDRHSPSIRSTARSSPRQGPVAQFNPFEKLDNPIMRAVSEDGAYKLWHRLSDEANRYLDGVEDNLIGRVKSSTP